MATCPECGASVKPKAMQQHEQFHQGLRDALGQSAGTIPVSPSPHDPPTGQGTEITKAL